MEANTPAPLPKRILRWLIAPWLLGGALFVAGLLFLGSAWVTGHISLPLTANHVNSAIAFGATSILMLILILLFAAWLAAILEDRKNRRQEHEQAKEMLRRYANHLQANQTRLDVNREAILHAITIMRALAEEVEERSGGQPNNPPRRLPTIRTQEDEFGDITAVERAAPPVQPRDVDPSRRPSRRISV